MRESEFRRQVSEILESFGLRAHRIENKIDPGMPDLLVLGPRGAVWIEMKTGTGLNPNQAMWVLRHPKENVLLLNGPQDKDHMKFRLARSVKTGLTLEWEFLLTGDWPMSEVVKSSFASEIDFFC